jgi:hypothetical protein
MGNYAYYNEYGENVVFLMSKVSGNSTPVQRRKRYINFLKTSGATLLIDAHTGPIEVTDRHTEPIQQVRQTGLPSVGKYIA